MKNIWFPKNEGCTRNFLGRGSVSLHQPRASFTNITAEPYKIRASKASVDDVGDGISSADSVKSQNDCHRQSATPTSRVGSPPCGRPTTRTNVSLHQPRASFTNITAAPYKIRTSKASVDDIGDGSRLPTRSNRKTIATGNLRPRRPE